MKDDDVKMAEGRLWVQRQHRKSGQDVGETEIEEKQLLIDKFVTEPAKVDVSVGLTLSIGSYEFIRIDVGVSLPCYKEEMAAAHQEAFEYTVAELMRRRKEIMNSLGR